ncbi:MAG: hypothetical protein HQ582_14780 [Planctomycetes bacterium]|nr:hypothetical protein [Planctomycetota bacterium]
MSRLGVHPGTMRLLRYQATARVSRTLRRLSSRRRLVLSILALLLGVVWVGQAALALLFRQPADPQKLQVWIPLGLLAYTLWHLLKTACRRPIEPFEWTAAEREILGAAPLRRSEMVMYRLASVGMAAAAKATCFSLIMLPDLRVWWAGLMGMLLALLLVDLLRMAFEIFAYGISRRVFLEFRTAVLIVAGTCAVSAVVSSLCAPRMAANSSLPQSLGFVLQLLDSLMQLGTTWVGTVAELPFRVFGRLILVPALSLALLGYLVAAVATVVGMARAVVWLDGYFLARRLAAEQARFSHLLANSTSERGTSRDTVRPVRLPYRLCGIGSLAWRQMLGALHHRTALLVSLVVTAILSCVTLLRHQTDLTLVAELVANLVFYSFLLLPTALKFDFRRDVDRLAVIKALPVSPMSVTLGQLAIPVSITTLLQAIVLVAAMAVRQFHPGLLVMALIVLVPVNVLIFALENLIFMLYPYRPGAEGIGVFIRSILTFTGKGILFAIGLVVTVLWALVSRGLGLQLTGGSGWVGSAMVFTTGMWLLTVSVAAVTTVLLAGVYRRFDPSQDTPAMS